MKVRFRTAATLTLFALIILARQATGAPNAQVAFAGNIGSPASFSIQDVERDFNQLQTILDRPGSEKKETTYKKYIPPEIQQPNYSTVIELAPSIQAPVLPELWCNANIPIEVLAHAPPFHEVNSSFINHFENEGEFKFADINYQCSRGISFSSSRSA